MPQFEMPICLDCIHFHEGDLEGFTCNAFPEGVPLQIVTSAFDHHYAFPGDHGIVFQQTQKGERILIESDE